MSVTPEEAGEDVLCSRIFKTDEISAIGVSECLVVNDQERAAIAEILDLLSLESMRMDFKLRRSGRGRYKLTAHLFADVAQSCVVTLDPVESKIDERFAIEFWPPEEVALLESEADEDGTEVPLEGPEPIVGGHIDVGQIAYEYFAASLEPNPRRPGASFDWQDPRIDPASEAGDKPFAELARLKYPKDANSD